MSNVKTSQTQQQFIYPDMKFMGWLDTSQFLGYLNGTRNYGQDLKLWIRGNRMMALENTNPANATWASMAIEHFQFAADGDYAEAGNCVKTRLRMYVDQWLASGFDANGLEEPQKRHLLPEHSTPNSDLTTFLNRWLSTHHPQATVFATGEIRQQYSRRTEVTRDNAVSPIQDANDELARELIYYLQSPLKWTLTRCANAKCGHYYVRRRPRALYKSPTYCSACRRSATARLAMDRKRAGERHASLDAAAIAFNRWPTLSDSTRRRYRSDERAYITQAVRRFGISRTWVSRNLSEIERVAGGSNHATRKS